MSLTTYKRYVEGETPIPSDKLIALAHAFHCSADYLLGLTPSDHHNGR
ncbi:MAG: helix-turn-helix domain-containing protein [Clostridiales bacterium]|nr:helix-turn-helix domain-containing protein [Clostridiales bacterium]